MQEKQAEATRRFRRCYCAGLFGAALLFALKPFASAIPFPQPELAPKFSIDADTTAFAFAPDNRIVFGARRTMHTKHYELEHDDLWVANTNGGRKRIVDGDKFVKTRAPYSYAINALAWSPDGRKLTVGMATEEVTDAQGTVHDSDVVDLMDDEGKEINIEGTKNSAIFGAFNGVWLGDGVTVAFLSEAVSPKLLFELSTVRPAGGRGGKIFDGHYFVTVAWDAAHGSAIAIERNKNLNGPIQLVSLDLIRQKRTELATLDGFLGQLTVSPTGKRIAYFHDGELIEIRETASPDKVIRVGAAYGRLMWAPDERQLLLKRGPEKRSGDLQWVAIPSGNLTPALSGLLFSSFEISPDGHFIGVTQPGKRVLMVYPLQ